MGLKFDIEKEGWAFSKLRLHTNFASIFFNDLLRYVKTKPDTFLVQMARAFDEAKKFEQLVLILLTYANTGIYHRNFKLILPGLILMYSYNNFNVARLGEF